MLMINFDKLDFRAKICENNKLWNNRVKVLLIVTRDNR